MKKQIPVRYILHKLLFPHGCLTGLLALGAAALLIYVFAGGTQNRMIEYGAYALSAYALVTVCIRVPAIVRWAKALKKENPYLSRYFSSAALRVKTALYGSLAVNLVYAVMQFGLGLWNHSVWFYALSAYYFLLALMRFFLLRETRKDRGVQRQHFEWRRYRFCGVMLLVMILALSVIIACIVGQNREFSYHDIMTIAMAAYTFFTFTTAVVKLIRYRKYQSPVMSAAKAVDMAAALVSMLSLETAMFAAFGEKNTPLFRKVMTAGTGTAVCLTIFLMAVFMIVHAERELRRITADADCSLPLKEDGKEMEPDE